MFSLLDLLPLALFVVAVIGIKFAKPIRNGIHEDFLSVESGKSIRGLLALIIVLHHLANRFSAAESGVVFRIFCDIGFLAVSIFFFISGYGLQKQHIEKENYSKGFLLKRLPTVLIPYIIVNVIYWAMSFLYEKPLGILDILKGLIDGSPVVAHSWYIISIIVFYIAFAVLMWICKKRHGLMLLLASVFYVVYAFVCIKLNYGAWWYNTAFVLIFGMIWAVYEKQIMNLLKKCYWLVSVISVIAFAVMFIAARFLPESDFPIKSILASAFFSVLALLVFAKIKFENPILKFVGKISLELYLCHEIFIILFRSNVCFIENNLVYSLISIFSALIFAWLLNLTNVKLLTIYKKAVLK
ncbi:MAG: acyltransferase [Clostridia bacterium]|nr:acyltransferase [Clostridia bacterium]